ncbi:MAG TPA: porin family protein [Bacteroidales bacterium]|nr:porin family protein [Bacteroidales bacterium]
MGYVSLIAVNAQVLGVKGGLSFATGRYVIYEFESSSGNLFGVSGGILGEVPLSDALSLGTGISFVKKGARTDVYKIPVRYLEFPINLTYRLDFISWKLFAQAGPYAAAGISAKRKNNVSNKISFGSRASQFKRMDYGINLGAGFEIGNLQIGINYGFGFLNISHAYREVIRNRLLTVSAVYYMEDVGYTLGNLWRSIF